MILSNDSLVAFHYRSYGTFFLHKNRLHNIYKGFTHYKYYRAQNQKGKDCLAILFLIFYPSTLNFFKLPKNNEPPIIARIPPTHPNTGIKPTAPPTIRRTEGADPTRSSPL